MGRAMTTDAISRQVDHMLPLVAFPAYEIFATQARERAGWEVISYTPFLHNRTQLDEFDEFTQQHHDWIATTQQGKSADAAPDTSSRLRLCSITHSFHRSGENY